MFDDKTSIHTLEFMQCLGCQYPYWWYPHLCQQFSSLATIQRVFFVYRLHLVHVKDAQGRWFVNVFFFQSPPNHEAHALFLMLNDERCLNALLLAVFLRSNSSHLLWKRDLESYEYLEACSDQWQVLLPSKVGNTSMSLDRWILQVFNLNTFIHTYKKVPGALIPTFIIGRLSRVC